MTRPLEPSVIINGSFKIYPPLSEINLHNISCCKGQGCFLQHSSLQPYSTQLPLLQPMSRDSFHSKAAAKISYNIKLKIIIQKKAANKTLSGRNPPFLLWQNLSHTRPAAILKKTKLLLFYWKSQTTHKECKKQMFTVSISHNYSKNYCMTLWASTSL